MMLFSYIRSLFLLSLPLIGGHIAQILIGVGDTLIVGRYSTESLAALVLGTTIFFIIFIFGRRVFICCCGFGLNGQIRK